MARKVKRPAQQRYFITPDQQDRDREWLARNRERLMRKRQGAMERRQQKAAQDETLPWYGSTPSKRSRRA